MKKLNHPYGNLMGGEWLRGNLHAHSTQSDGAHPPQAIIDDYASRGYDFLMFSDHDFYTSDEACRQLDSHGMVLISGNEIAGGPHLLHIDAERHIPQSASRQEILNAILQAERESGRGFAIVNHPNWEGKFDHATIAQMREWTGYLGMEIYNGVIGVLDGSPYATNKWDILLSEGRRLWGFANDDAHRPSQVGLGWNVAYATERTRAGVVEALRNGRFYCSTGVVITAIQVDGMTVRLETENAERIVALTDIGKRLTLADDRMLEVTVPDNARYLRFECWGRGEQFAWTQPFFVDDIPGSPAASIYLNEWRASERIDHRTLAEASLKDAADMRMLPIAIKPLENRTYGLVDLRPQINEKPGLVYARSVLGSDADKRAILTLGYDGPIRVWLNGQSLFMGPGTNPAIEDQVKLYIDLRQGDNDLLVAFDSNGGHGWGFFAKLIS